MTGFSGSAQILLDSFVGGPAMFCARLLPALGAVTLTILGVLAVCPAKADTITFLDGQENRFGFSALGSRAGTGLTLQMSTESMVFQYPTPSQAFGIVFSLGGFVDILDPNSNAVSDLLHISIVEGFTIELDFTSDNDTGSLFTCSTLTPCAHTIVEDGTVQTAATITYTDINGNSLGIDTVRFQSDVETSTSSVPQPSSLILLGTGLLGIMLARRRVQRM
jgi:hypothetical protein